MTFLERLEREHPDFIGNRYPGGVALCPEDCGYEKRSPCEAMAGGSFDPSACLRCWNRQADAAGGGESQPVCSAAVEKCEEKRKPEAFFGNRKAGEAEEPSQALRASSPKGGAKDAEEKGGGDGGSQDH